MKEVYRDREQTYLKHFFLERYLEKVAYIIGWNYGSFVYVDAFSGPWRSGDENFDDTSFMIAINKLRQVRDGLAERRRSANIRCLFVEKDPESFATLERAIGRVGDLPVKAIHGAFVDVIPDLLRYVGRTFSLTFIDPTGWAGIPLNGIGPMLQHNPGEVLINLMTDFVVRFGNTSESLMEMMGGPGFEDLTEAEKVELYCERIRAAGGFDHVTSTRIKKTKAERSYFHLVYGTRHLRGLEKFREVEHKEIEEQECVRIEAKDLDRMIRTGGQQALFASNELAVPSSFAQELLDQKRKATSRLNSLLDEHGRVSYEDVLRTLLELPLVWEKTIKQIIKEQQLEIEGLEGRQRAPRKGCFLVRK